MALSPNQRGAFFMALAMAGFTINDAVVKYLSKDMPMGEIIFLRGVVATTLIFILAHRAGALRPLRVAGSRWVALRAVGEVTSTLTFLIGLAHIPLANATAIMQALPLAVTMGAALFLAEPVGWRRWTAILIGFAGVMLIVRPGLEGFSPYALFIVSTVFFAALRDLATRKIDTSIPTLFVSVVTAVVVTISGPFLDRPTTWVALDWGKVVLILVTAGLILCGYLSIILAMRVGEISFIAPFRYTSFLFALVFGYLVFGDLPDMFMIVGGAIVIGSGLYTLYREHVRVDAREIAATSTPPQAP
jgi:Permeases of the drug/metabolite transporter (DMT) superfamily